MISGLFSLPLGPADAADMAVRSPLRDECEQTSEAFIAGPENALVRTLWAAVSCQVLPYNPIVIYGPAGIGKSSLAHALAARRRQVFHLASVIVTTGADLARGLAHAIDTASASEFRSRHHRCDLLLIDDVQCLVGKQPAQQFLLTEIDALLRRGSLVIATLRQSPQATPGLAPALASRLAGGLVVGLAPPGPLARCELVRQAAERAGLSLDEDQIARLAGASDGPRFRFTTPARLRHLVLKLAAATEFGTVGDSESMPRVEDESSAAKSVCRHVAAAVARHFDLTATELKGKSRRQAVAEARSLAMYIARRLTKASYAELGRHFGGRDHTTVLHACRKVAREVGLDETTRRIADDLTIQIAAKGVT